MEKIVKVMKILVALDGSRWAEVALPTAVELAKQNAGATIVVVRAVDPATVAGVGATEAKVGAINEAAEYLGNVAAQLRKAGVRPVGRSVWYAAAGPAIVGVARAVKADVIVMAAGHRSDAGRLAAGRIAEFVLHRAGKPILLVAAEDAPAEPPARRAIVQETEMVYA